MKYQLETTINAPINKVIELFDSTENMKKWQPELVSFNHVSGTPGKAGAVSKLVYKIGKKNVEMIETITVNNLPHEFSGIYEANNVKNPQMNFFEPTENGKTKWTVHSEFQCNGFMRIMAALMPWAFKSQTKKFMNQFKQFVESN